MSSLSNDTFGNAGNPLEAQQAYETMRDVLKGGGYDSNAAHRLVDGFEALAPQYRSDIYNQVLNELKDGGQAADWNIRDRMEFLTQIDVLPAEERYDAFMNALNGDQLLCNRFDKLRYDEAFPMGRCITDLPEADQPRALQNFVRHASDHGLEAMGMEDVLDHVFNECDDPDAMAHALVGSNHFALANHTTQLAVLRQCVLSLGAEETQDLIQDVQASTSESVYGFHIDPESHQVRLAWADDMPAPVEV